MIRTQYLVAFNLPRMMRDNEVTIEDLSHKTGITQKRIRELRKMAKVPFATYLDMKEAVTGEKPTAFEMFRFHQLSARGIL